MTTPSDAPDRLKAEIAKAGGLRKFAHSIGYSATYVSQVNRGELPFSRPLLKALGYVHVPERWETPMTTKPLGKGFTIKDGKVKPIATGSVSDKIRAKKSKKVKPGRKP